MLIARAICMRRARRERRLVEPWVGAIGVSVLERDTYASRAADTGHRARELGGRK